MSDLETASVVLAIDAIAAARPSAPALVEVGSARTTTYGELASRSARLATLLVEMGVSAGDRVAVLADARREVFEAQFACRRIGAAMAPLNWRLSERERQAVVELARPAALLADPQMGGCGVEIPTLVLGGAYEDALASARECPARDPAPGEIGQLLFTSGTTGAPKGAMLSWRQIEFNAAATIGLCELSRSSKTLAFLPTFHTGGLNCLALPTLAAGGRVIIMRRFEAEQAVRLLSSGEVTATIAVPSMYRSILDAGLKGIGVADAYLLVGGAPLPSDLGDAYAELGCPLRQGFGMTEVGPNCFSLGRVDVGVATPGTRARLVNLAGADCAVGEVGELELSGPHVFAGYFENPAATREAMHGEWFRTGDLASADEAGRFTIRGRSKDMFISGGENVYPAEIELALAKHPSVADVSVIAVPDSRWGEVGAAVVVAEPGSQLDPAALRTFAREHLANYKVPRHIVLADALPRTPTGKVAKAAVRELFFALLSVSLEP